MEEIRERKTHNLRASNSSFRNSHHSILILKLCPNFRLGEASTDIESSKIVVILNFLDNSSKISSPISKLLTSSLNSDCLIWWSLNVLDCIQIWEKSNNTILRFKRLCGDGHMQRFLFSAQWHFRNYPYHQGNLVICHFQNILLLFFSKNS